MKEYFWESECIDGIKEDILCSPKACTMSGVLCEPLPKQSAHTNKNNKIVQIKT